MKAYIIKDTKKKDALWLIVQRQELPLDVDEIMGMFKTEDTDYSTAYAILEDEVEAIKQACIDYLKENDKQS